MPEQPDNIVPITRDARSAAEKFGAEHDRELLTILFTDLVDSTKLQSDLGNVEAARLVELHREIVREELAKYDAREIEWAGDSCLAVFTKPSDGVMFALGMQAAHRRIRRDEHALPHVRVGIHLGEIIIRHGAHKEDIFGLQVSETARVMSMARGGQIYCTRTVFDNARSSLKGASLEGVGSVVWLEHQFYEVKGSERPIEICEVGENELAPLKPPVENDKCRAVSSGSTVDTATSQDAPSGNRWLAPVAGLIIVVLVAAVAYLVGTRETPVEPAAETAPTIELAAPEPVEPPRPVRSLMSIADAPMARGLFGDVGLALSPDGSNLVYVGMVEGETMLVLRSMENQLETRVLPGTEGANNPFFSPDGKWVAFYDSNQLKKISLSGGTPVVLAESTFNVLGTWGEDGYILYVPHVRNGIHRVHESGGPPERVTEIAADDTVTLYPILLPGGSAIVYGAAASPQIENARVIVHPLDGRADYVIATGAARSVYVPTGHLLFVHTGRLTAQPFDVDTLSLIGSPATVSEQYISEADTAPVQFSVSSNGTFVYAPGGSAAEMDTRRELVWVDRDGNEESLGAPLQLHYSPRISPDGRKIVTALVAQTGGTDVWVLDIARGALSLLTQHSGPDTLASWLPDGRIVFSSNRDGSSFKLFTLDPEELDPEVLQLTTGDGLHFAANPTADPTKILLSVQNPGSGFDIGLVDTEKGTEVEILVQTPFAEGNAVMSPNERWMVYGSAETGVAEVYLIAYPALRGRITVSTDGGISPTWSADGSEIFYRNGSKMMAVSVEEADGELRIGQPVELFDRPYYIDPLQSRMYDISPIDGRFLMVRQLSDEEAREGITELVVVTNWFEDLKQYAPYPDAN